MTNNDIAQKLWNLCDVLRDDGINYSDYVTELVLLLFIKMESEQVSALENFKHRLPEGCRWSNLTDKSGINLLDTYKRILLTLSTGKETVADPEDPSKTSEKVVVTDQLVLAIYNDAQTRMREPRHLATLVSKLDEIDWFSAEKDGLGDLYEGLLEKNAGEKKSGAGQYFTPRPLIDSIIRCIKPKHGEKIQDPAAGTAGFLTAAHEFIKSNTDDLYDLTDKQQKDQIKKMYVGMELVPDTRRLSLMNCLLHGIEGEDQGAIRLGNTLGEEGAKLPSPNLVLSNPPFGTSKGGGIMRKFTHTTSNKQLAFMQHIYNGLEPGGRAAVVLPDNVLFEAGVGTDIRRDLMSKCNLHTILRLPTGIFYAQGVKTNVLFFQKGTAENIDQDENCTQNVWYYDLRTNMPSFGKRTPFTEEILKPFEKAYGDDPNGRSPRTDEGEEGRFRCFTRDYIAEQKGDSLDISWIKDENAVDAADLPEPDVLAAEAMGELTEALRELNGLMEALGANDEAAAQRTLLADALALGGNQ